MSKLRIGVLGPADIAKRRMIPALIGSENYEFTGVAVANVEERNLGAEKGSVTEADLSYKKGLEKAEAIKDLYGGNIYDSFSELIEVDNVDVIYIALPPSKHAIWGEKVLSAGKHLLLEKPFTTEAEDTGRLLDIAENKGLAVIENFGFIYHPQMDMIRQIIESEELGEIRCIRSNFSFPHRGLNDFRYKKEMGGGALLDCGCYTLKLAQYLMSEDMRIEQSRLFYTDDCDVDICGCITATSGCKYTQLSFSMDQQYRCDLEIWGSKGALITDRIYTAPPDHKAKIMIKKGLDEEILEIEPSDQFRAVADKLAEAVMDKRIREELYNDIKRQSELVQSIKDWDVVQKGAGNECTIHCT